MLRDVDAPTDYIVLPANYSCPSGTTTTITPSVCAHGNIHSPLLTSAFVLYSALSFDYSQTVKEGDLLIDLESAEFIIPKPGQQTSDTMDAMGMGDIDPSMSSIGGENKGCLKLPHQEQPVPNCCAVCLGSYHVGDEVVWSSNPRCAHAFHKGKLRL